MQLRMLWAVLLQQHRQTPRLVKQRYALLSQRQRIHMHQSAPADVVSAASNHKVHLQRQPWLCASRLGAAQVPHEEAAVEARGCKAVGGSNIVAARSGTAAAKGDCADGQPAGQGAYAAQAPVLGGSRAICRRNLPSGAEILKNVRRLGNL